MGKTMGLMIGKGSGVALTGMGVVCPAGIGLNAFRDWWRAGRPDCTGPPSTLKEPWLPMDRVGEVPDWNPKKRLPERKSIKLMNPAVQLGTFAAMEAWGVDPPDTVLAPERRGIWVGCGTSVDEDNTFNAAILEAVDSDGLDMVKFGGPSQDLLNPLWLVKGLTNNILAFTARYLRAMGPNDNFEAGAAGPLQALGAACEAIGAGRLDRALAGGSDSLVRLEDVVPLAGVGAFDGPTPLVPSQGAAFVRLEAGSSGDFGVLGFASGFAPVAPGEAPHVGPAPPSSVGRVVARLRERAWAQVPAKARGAALRIRGPFVPGGSDIDLWTPLGDPGAGAGALLLPAAWAARSIDKHRGPIELAAVGPRGDVAVTILGALP
jgi:hypothetical protein